MKYLQDKVALVTGGSRGIGRAICIALGQRGAHVLVNYASRSEDAEKTAELVREAGGEATILGFDVSDPAATKNAIDAAVKELGGLQILVNNAGVAKNGLLMRYKDEDWQSCLGINLGGAFNCTKSVMRHILKAKTDGRIVNISSVVGESGNPGQSAYAASKAGLLGFTKSVAKETASRGVCVNAITPGFIATDMMDAELPEERRQTIIDSIPLGRIGNAEEVASVVAFLVGPHASYITGQVIRVNGGMLM